MEPVIKPLKGFSINWTNFSINNDTIKNSCFLQMIIKNYYNSLFIFENYVFLRTNYKKTLFKYGIFLQ